MLDSVDCFIKVITLSLKAFSSCSSSRMTFLAAAVRQFSVAGANARDISQGEEIFFTAGPGDEEGEEHILRRPQNFFFFTVFTSISGDACALLSSKVLCYDLERAGEK